MGKGRGVDCAPEPHNSVFFRFFTDILGSLRLSRADLPGVGRVEPPETQRVGLMDLLRGNDASQVHKKVGKMPPRSHITQSLIPPESAHTSTS